MLGFYYDQHDDHWILFPTISICRGGCECCDSQDNYALTIDFLCWSFGLVFSSH